MKVEGEYRPQLELAVKELRDILSNYQGGSDKFRDNVYRLHNLLNDCVAAFDEPTTVTYGHGEALWTLAEKAEVAQGFEKIMQSLLIEYENIVREWKIMRESSK